MQKLKKLFRYRPTKTSLGGVSASHRTSGAVSPSARFWVAVLVTLSLGALSPLRVQAESCGQPVSAGASPTSTDALTVLRVAVDLDVCTLCVCDVNASRSVTATDALTVLSAAVAKTPITACAECDECPQVAQFALFAGTRGACTTNADCSPFAICDSELGRCRTRTKIDSGWSGLAHLADANDTVPARLFLDCGAEAPCGECAITGIDPVLGNCRCANDNRTACFNPHEADDACGGSTCECYFGPPLPLSSGNAPTCVLNRLEKAPGGTADVDAGAGSIELPLESVVHLGLSNLAPCPYCTNDPAPGNGMREGTCVGGLNDGASCDAQSPNTTFPHPTGAAHSLDCFPDPNTNVSGQGLGLDVVLTTGATTLEANVTCGGDPTAMCPCRVCTGDLTLACNADSDCADAGAGLCASDGNGVPSEPNSCEDGLCAVQANGAGECTVGPVDRYCDGVLRPDGRGIITCATDVECSAAVVGVDAGECTLLDLRECFLDTITAQGAAHPLVPTGAAAYCIPPTSNVGINSVAGLPGPGRLVYQALLTSFCTSDPRKPYSPGTGNCP